MWSRLARLTAAQTRRRRCRRPCWGSPFRPTCRPPEGRPTLSTPAKKFSRIFSGGLPLPQGEGWGEGTMQFPIDYPLILSFSTRVPNFVLPHPSLESSRREKGALVLL